MSQKVSRKVAVNEDKEKRQAESPVKEMKKKMAANAEKEKQAAEKEKNAEKTADKVDKSVEKVDKKTEKVDKSTDKKNEKVDKITEKKAEKSAEKKTDLQTEKKEDSSKGEKSAKSEKQDQKKPESSKSKQNGNNSKAVHNGVTDVTLSSNGCTEEVLNGTVSGESDDDEMMLVIDDHDQDELFPELTYDDTSDTECFESPTPDNAPSRSFTRRSQVKATRTPETPRPASDKLTDKDTNTDDPKESKVLKLKDDALATDRKLRSSDSPKPQEVKKPQETAKKPQDSPKPQEKSSDSPKKQKADDSPNEIEDNKEGESKQGVDVPPDAKEESEKVQETGEKTEKEVDVVIEIESADEEPRKPDTNYSKSRVKVSPYRRSMRIADQTTSSVMANYTGNNTTMEMDITETSSFLSESAASLDDSSYLRGLRAIRGRNSYKQLKDINLRHVNRSARSAGNVSGVEQQARPTGTVVGRKRKQDAEWEPRAGAVAGAEPGVGAGAEAEVETEVSQGKRARLLERLAQPFRRVATRPSPARPPAEIVGINTDLPLTAPVLPAAAASFDPETLKAPAGPQPRPSVQPAAPHGADADPKRCIVM